MLLLVVLGSVGSTVRLVNLDFGVLVGVPRGAEARSDSAALLMEVAALLMKVAGWSWLSLLSINAEGRVVVAALLIEVAG